MTAIVAAGGILRESIKKGCRLMEPATRLAVVVQAGGDDTVSPNRDSPNDVWKREHRPPCTRTGRGKCESEGGAVEMRDSRFVIRVMGLGAAAAFALHPARAGERKPAHHLEPSSHRVALVAPARSNLHADLSKAMPKDVRDNFVGVRSVANPNATRAEFHFVPVTPLRAGAADGSRSDQGDPVPTQKGPITLPAERKNITLFRLDPKLGDVSVQPVVGGVNGAQLLVGF
jgi:hypothetical protein